MGLKVKRNKNKEYQLISTISDESYHPDKKWITEDEAKKILMERKVWEFVKSIIEIEMTFPSDYFVNGKRTCDNSLELFNRFWLDGYKDETIIKDKFTEIKNRLNLDFEL